MYYNVTASYLAGYSHVTEMEAIGSVDETPTELIIDWVENVLPKKSYLPLMLRSS